MLRGLCLVMLLAAPSWLSAADARPNVLFLFADDMRAESLGALGDKTVKTPHLDAVVQRVGYCVVVASEGIRTADGRFVADSGGGRDSFGHAQLGGVAAHLAGRVKAVLGHKVHWTLPDYLQRSARHLASKTDLEQALAVGRAAVECALAGQNAVMPVIVRTSDAPYRWHVDIAPLDRIANHEKKMPANFIRKDGFGITAAARRYLSPLVAGEAPPPYAGDGLPAYVEPKLALVRKKLPTWAG